MTSEDGASPGMHVEGSPAEAGGDLVSSEELQLPHRHYEETLGLKSYNEPAPDTYFYRSSNLSHGTVGGSSFRGVPRRVALNDLLLGFKPMAADSEEAPRPSGLLGHPGRARGASQYELMSILQQPETAGSPTSTHTRLESAASGSVSTSAFASGAGEVIATAEERMELHREKSSGGGGGNSNGYSFGMWEGVVIRCLLNIWGVMMFLRASWVVGEAGWGGALGVLTLCVTVTTLTTISLSAICSNGEVKAGGAYFMISRSLGPEFGGSIGLAFFAANSVSVALYLIGFAEAVGIVMDEPLVSSQWDDRIFALLAMVLMSVVALVGGGSGEIFMQKVLLVVLVGAMLSYLIGTFAATGDDVAETGITGLDSATLADNVGSDYSPGTSFIGVTAVFFPAVTGVMAGANISGDLADPARAIPSGTMLAIVLSTIVYALFMMLLGASVDRETLKDYENSIVVVDISIWSPLVYAGIFAATLSSALAQIIGAPRILMALARDDLFPFLRPFAKGVGPNDEPVNGYILTMGIATAAILAGDLNTVSPLITEFFLASYALCNYACFASSVARSPGWRPTYKYYSPYVALLGGILCFAMMLMVDLLAAGITIVVCGLLKTYVAIRSVDVNWGSVGEAYRYVQAVNGMWRLEKCKDAHVKNFRPQYLVFCRNPTSKEHLIRFVSQINEGRGGMIVGTVIPGSFEDRLNEYRAVRNSRYLVEQDVQSFTDCVVAPSFLLGCQSLLQISGMGKLRPNTVVLGYLSNWQERQEQDVEEYIDVIRASFGAGYAVTVMRGVDEIGKVPIRNGTIDVWWLIDDGGLTILIPHILRLSTNWRQCKLRVLTVASHRALTSEQVRMQRLLRKFRIQAELVVVDSEKVDSSESEKFEQKFRDMCGGGLLQKDKSQYFVRLSQLLHMHSTAASLLVVTLPVPRYTVSPMRYMAYQSMLTDGLPPTILIRGNQQSVITWAM
jgi:solute carrier family 12 sodium/potassium/chloride transporter 2